MPPAPDSLLFAYDIHRPDGAVGPWVFASPHSGALIPPDPRTDPTLDAAALRSAEDVAMDLMARPGVALGAPLITCRVSRAHVDVNRAPDELDPQVVEGLDEEAAISPRVRAGYGVIPRLTGDGRHILTSRLPLEDAQKRIDQVHTPYHQALAALMLEARSRHGRAVLIDWHSMPAGPRGGPDVVVGDRHGSSCSSDLTRRARLAFERRGWRVALNRPYAGGYSTRLWGRPDEGLEALQIELSRGRYLAPPGAVDPVETGARKLVAQVIAELMTPA